MKSLVQVGFLLILELLIFSYAEVWGSDWRLNAYNDQFTQYYDAENITRPTKNVVRVWVRTDFTDRGVITIVGKLGKEYKNLSHTRTLDEINCSDKKRRTLSLYYYSKNGDVIYFDKNASPWDYIVPGSVPAALYKAVCK